MKQVEVAAYDDLDWTKDQAKVRATHTVYLGLDGKWVELDLTEAHLIELATFIAPYMEAGHVPEKTPTRKISSSRTGRTRQEAIELNKALAVFAEARGLPYTPATKTSGAYFPKATREAYDDHLETLERVQ